MRHGIRGLLGAVHAGKRALGWDEATYRDVLRQVTGKASAKDCTQRELEQLITLMRERGFAPKAGAPAFKSADRPEVKFIRALWAELAAAGAVTDASEEGLSAFVERQAKVSRLEWCDTPQLRSVLEGLKAWSARVRATSATSSPTATTSPALPSGEAPAS
jgi:phage gp16-like protein